MKKFYVSLCCLFMISAKSFATVTFILSVTGADCIGNDGSVVVSVTSGTGPYAYSIDGGAYQFSAIFANLSPGNHMITVTDALGDTGSGVASVPGSGTNTYSNKDTAVCQNSLPFLFGNQSIDSPGIYMDTLTNSTGCDSIITLQLIVIPVIESTTNAQVCASQLPFIFNGQSYNTAGSYTITLTGDSGCDSLANLLLSITNSNEWLGTVNTSWETAGNWSCNAVPGPTTDVVINSGTVIVHANTTVNTLTVSSGAHLTISAGVNLVVLH